MRDALLAVEVLSVFTTERPWQVTLDLPALTARRDRVLGRRDA